MASVTNYKTKTGKRLWKFQIYVGFNPDGSRKRIIKQGFQNKKAAILAYSRIEQEYAETGIAITDPKFKDVYEKFFATYKNTVKEPTWVKTSQYFRLHILPTFENRRMSKISPSMVQEFVDEYFDKGYVKYKVLFNWISKVFKYAIKMDMCKTNPADKVTLPRQNMTEKIDDKEDFYDLEEMKHFFECLKDFDDPQAYAFFRLLAFSGCRKSELACLQYKDINWTKRSITISKTQSRGEHGLIVTSPKTYTSNREVMLDTNTMKVLENWRIIQRKRMLIMGFNANNDEQLVFSNVSKNEMIQPGKSTYWLNEIIDRYELKKVTVHSFRASYATLAFEGGLNVKQVQHQLGHRDIQTTMEIYMKVSKKKEDEIADKFVAYVNF
ncbi:tyrosine-type recombinase/integrase [Paucilactobacillus nenjiangensis]|uniref:tyrosine-type recombinase/integrase n=1 Tax=Paucilactobacillus nenjiangensis TaxID=1296540 RepID=UPI0010F4923E|nr:tyrosine-type recombinase/integrase [Paucilactobacillus nenjiangensis]